MQLEIRESFDRAAREAADRIATAASRSIQARGRFTLALSGGSTPWPMLEHLGERELDWGRVHVLQVDERCAPDGDEQRNWTQITRTLLESVRIPPANLHPMPVLAEPAAAAAAYARSIVTVSGGDRSIDVVQLGLGDDGHTASLVPDDPVLEVRDRDVAWCGEYRGAPRMTLTYPSLDRARSVLWLVSGEGKAAMVARLFDADPGIPAGRVSQAHATLFADTAAASRLDRAQ